MKTEVEKHIQQGDMDNAFAVCAEYLGKRCELEAYELAAKVAIELRSEHNWAKSLEGLLLLEEKWPNEKKPLVFNMELGHVFRHHQRHAEALVYYQRVVEEYSAHEWGNLWVAKSLYSLGEISRSLDVAKKLQKAQGLQANLHGELLLLLVDIALAQQDLSAVNRFYLEIAQRHEEFPPYIVQRMLDLLYVIPDKGAGLQCCLSFAFKFKNNPDLMFRVAKYFYQNNNPLLTINALLNLEAVHGLAEHHWNLLIASALESPEWLRGEIWTEAKALIDKNHSQRENKNGYWQYWTDYWGDKSAQSIKNGQNVEVHLSQILGDFKRIYWANRADTGAIIDKEQIPQRVTSFVAKGGVKDCRLSFTMSVNEQTLPVEQFNLVGATRFLSEHGCERVRRAWRLARHDTDKKNLFYLFYLVKYGGIVVPAWTLERGDGFRALLHTNHDVVFVKAMMGVSTDFVGAKPNHPLLKAMLESAVQSLLNRSRLPDLYTTGSVAWINVLNQYCREMRKRKRQIDIGILSGNGVSGLV